MNNSGRLNKSFMKLYGRSDVKCVDHPAPLYQVTESKYCQTLSERIIDMNE